MNWFYNLKTMTKLVVAFALVSVALAAVGYVGVSGMLHLEGAIDTLYHRDLIGMKHLARARFLSTRMGRTVREAVIDPDEKVVATARERVDQGDGEVRAELDKVEPTLIVPEGKARLASARSNYAEVVKATREALKRVEAKDSRGAAASLASAQPFAAQLEADFEGIFQIKDNLGANAYQDAITTYDESRRLQIGAILAGILFGAFCSYVVGRSISGPLVRAEQVLADVARGDFTKRVDIGTTDEIGLMARALNKAVDAMRSALSDVRTVAGEVASASQQLSSAAEDISSGAQEQAANLEETASSLEEITSTVKQNADNAQDAAALASGSRDVAEKGERVVEAAVGAMNEITHASKRISDIIGTIDEIAFQTNILALNAAVEAARAGEQGRGFAVVASEVRSLAQRSASAAKEIKRLIGDSVEKIEAGSKHVSETGQTFHGIVTSVKRVTDMVGEIAAASQEQKTSIEQVNIAVTQMDQVTQSNAAQTEEMSSTADALATHAEQLQALVARFRLDEEIAAPSGMRTASAPPTREGSRTRTRAARPKEARAGSVGVRMRSPSGPAGTSRATGTDGFDEF